MTSHHLYVHVPFCRLVCAYCDFVTVGGRGADIPRYVDALMGELEMRPAVGRLETIYFGGGTPSLLPAEAVARLVSATADRWHAKPVEVTIEANPGARERPDWRALRAAGVTRVSLGAQSLRDAELRTLARGHGASEVREAVNDVRAAGFENLSIDLIYAIPGQSLDDWEAGLRASMAVGPEHLSLYALQLATAPDEWSASPRPGAIRWRRRLAARQDDGLAADQYRLAEEVLQGAGYRHYELSSWARPGFESRHNRAYWRRRPYTGIGAGAHSYDGSRRWWNARDLDAYLGLVEAGDAPVAGAEELDEGIHAFEAVALGLREVAGLDRREFAAEFGQDPLTRFAEAVERGRSSGLLRVGRERLTLTPAGRLMANEVLEAFLPAAG